MAHVKNNVGWQKGKKAKIITIPKPAPWFIPSKLGQAIGFCEINCKFIPARPKEMPTKQAVNDLGNRVSKIILYSNVSE